MDLAQRTFLPQHAYEPDDVSETEEDDEDEEDEDEEIESSKEPITPSEPLTAIHHANIEEPSPPAHVDLEFEALTKAKQIKSCAIELLEGKIQFFSSADKENFGFLAETVDLVVSYLSEQTAAIKAIYAYSVLLKAFLGTLEETLTSIRKIQRREGVMTDSFEVFELAIRRYLEQFRRMFPINTVVPPPTIIVDPDARALWVKSFGADRHYVAFDLFEHEIISKEFAASKDKLLNFLRLFLNFPQDDLITTYKWNNITRLFGPFREFVDNFSSFALGRGFLGLINRVRARELLLLEPGTESMYLVRFSRTIPDYLAFSYRSDGNVGHYINRAENGDIIPIKTFLAKRLASSKPINKAVNADAVLGAKTLHRYASGYADGYIT